MNEINLFDYVPNVLPVEKGIFISVLESRVNVGLLLNIRRINVEALPDEQVVPIMNTLRRIISTFGESEIVQLIFEKREGITLELASYVPVKAGASSALTSVSAGQIDRAIADRQERMKMMVLDFEGAGISSGAENAAFEWRDTVQDGRTIVATLCDFPETTKIAPLFEIPSKLPEVSISFCMRKLSRIEIGRNISLRRSLMSVQQKSSFGTHAGLLANSLAEFETGLAERNLGVWKCMITFAVTGSSVDAAERQFAILSAFSEARGFSLHRETYAGPAIYSASFAPGGYSPAMARIFSRERTLTDETVAAFVPIYGRIVLDQPKGLRFCNRDGEPVAVDVFSTSSAPHSIICGITGSGKSVLACNMVLNAARNGEPAFIIDIGGSYRKIVNHLHGESLVVSNDRGGAPAFDSLPSDDESTSFLSDILLEAIYQGTEDPTYAEINSLSAAIRKITRLVGRLEMPRLIDEVAAMNPRLAEQISLFVNGPFYGFFNMSHERLSRAKYISFDLAPVLEQKRIAPAVLMSIMHYVGNYCKQTSGRKLVVVDEAWSLLKSPRTAVFIENIFRTYRKYNTAAIIITQQPADLAICPAIIANAPNRFLLMQSPGAIPQIRSALSLDDQKTELLRGIRTCPPDFSEILFMSESENGVLRLQQDFGVYDLTTTRPEENGGTNGQSTE